MTSEENLLKSVRAAFDETAKVYHTTTYDWSEQIKALCPDISEEFLKNHLWNLQMEIRGGIHEYERILRLQEAILIHFEIIYEKDLDTYELVSRQLIHLRLQDVLSKYEWNNIRLMDALSYLGIRTKLGGEPRQIYYYLKPKNDSSNE